MKITHDFIRSLVHPILSIMKICQHLPKDDDFRFSRYESDVFGIELEINDKRKLHLKIKESSGTYSNFDLNFQMDCDGDKNFVSNNTSKNRFLHRMSMYNDKKSITTKWNHQFTEIAVIDYSTFGEELYFQNSTLHELPPYYDLKVCFDIHNIIDDAINLPFSFSVSYTPSKDFIFTEDMIMKKIWAMIPLMMD